MGACRMRLLRVTTHGLDAVSWESPLAKLQEELLRIPRQVFIVQNEAIDELASAGVRMFDHDWKHDNKGLASYLATARRGIEAIRTGYTAEGRLLLQGTAKLLEAAQHADCQCSFLIGVPNALFTSIFDKRSGHQGPDKTGQHPATAPGKNELIDLLPELDEPKELLDHFRGNSALARLARRYVLIAAKNDLPVLIQGETGTGKEVIAHAIHDLGQRGGHFIAVNCGAIPSTLFESELFGYAPGSFTDALPTGKPGLWEEAQNGTLFLDEIADLTPDCQVKVLRALEGREIRRVGDIKARAVNARIIAATSRDLFRMVETGRFREDLYYRLRRFLIRTPPVSANEGDIKDIIQQLWQDIAETPSSPLPEDIAAFLASLRWPGNYRSIKTVLRNIRDNFGTANICIDHVRALISYYGPCPSVASEESEFSFASEFHRMERLHQLREAAEVLTSVRNAFTPIARKSAVIPAELRGEVARHTAELEIVTRNPLAFPSKASFNQACEIARLLNEWNVFASSNVKKAHTLSTRRIVPRINELLGRLIDEASGERTKP